MGALPSLFFQKGSGIVNEGTEKFVLDKISQHDKDIVSLKESKARTEILFENILKTNVELSSGIKDLSKTMTNININMTKMGSNLDNNTTEICALNNKIDTINEKVDEKINDDINKNTIDIRTFYKGMLIKILKVVGTVSAGGLASYGLIEACTK